VTSAEPGFLELIEGWDGVGVVVRHDQLTGSWIFVALHDDTLGPATGGCRMKVYARPEEGLLDALRLSEGMTYKWAAMDFPFGGGKTVLAIPRPLVGHERVGLFHRFGELLNSLGGRYGTGADLGTTTEDMQTIAEVSEYVIGVHGRTEGPMDPSPFTALGVFEGIRASLRHRTGEGDVRGRRILVQGVGAVGAALSKRIVGAGGVLLLSDTDERRLSEVATELDAEVVEPENVYGTDCDVYAPCAIGATLNPETIATLRCQVVAGAANNQLASPTDAALLQDRDILYAPDYVINGGGAMAFTLIYQGEDRVAQLERRVSAIGATLEIIFDEASRGDCSPVVAAQTHVQRVLERGASQA
jgi:leucine dehydrogenase